MTKRIIALLLALILTVGLLPTVALAAEGDETTSTDNSVVIGKIENGSWSQGAPTQPTVEGVKTVDKAAEKVAGTDNQYKVTLTVVLEQTAEEQKPGAAATVLVLDTSGSMAYCAECGESKDCDHSYKVFKGTANSSGEYFYKDKGEYKSAHYCNGNHIGSHAPGWYTGYHRRLSNGTTIYVKKNRISRLDAAKTAAQEFLKTYSGLKFDTNGTLVANQTDRNLGRYVSVVTFETGVTLQRDWIDVSNPAGYKSVLGVFTGNSLKAAGGTNLDAGLTYAEYLLKQDTVKKATKNVIALTDGEPTFFIDTNEDAYGDDSLTYSDKEFVTIDGTRYRIHGKGDGCNQKTFDETVSAATAVKNVRNGGAKLYTVCFGVADKDMDYGNIKVGKYLETKIATKPANDKEKFAYDASNANELNTAFAAITNTIISGLSTGTVNDTLPTAGITAKDVDGNAISSPMTWKLDEHFTAAAPETTTEDGKTVTTYKYTKTYTVTINPDAEGLVTTEDGYAPLNGKTTLTVKSGDKDVEIPFPIPAGKVTPTTIETPITVKIRGNHDTKTYDGTQYSVTSYQVEINPNNLGYTANDFMFTGTATASGTNAGTYQMNLDASQFRNTNTKYTNVTFKVEEDGWLKIDPINLTIKAKDNTVPYDGTAHGENGYDVTGTLATGETVTSVKISGLQTEPGTYQNELKPSNAVIKKGDTDVSANYNITYVDGTLTITADSTEKVLTIKGKTSEVTYDGDPHTVSGYEVTYPAGTSEADFTITLKNSKTGSVTATDVKIGGDGKYMMDLTAGDFDVESSKYSNVRVNYTEDGWLKINPREITLQSGSGNKTYDGTALTKNEVTVTSGSFATGEGLDYNVTGSQTEVGSRDNTYTYTAKAGTTLTNYAITEEKGTITVNLPDPSIPTVTVDCINSDVSHSDKTGITLTAATQYELGDPQKVANEHAYTRTVTLTTAGKEYCIGEYNKDFDGHTEAAGGTTTITLKYSKEGDTWAWRATTANFFVNVLCNTPTKDVNLSQYVKKNLEVKGTLPTGFSETFKVNVTVDGQILQQQGTVTMTAAGTSNFDMPTVTLKYGKHTIVVQEVVDEQTKNRNIVYGTNSESFVLNVTASGVQYGSTDSEENFGEVTESPFVTITNKYTQPTKTFDLNTLIFKNFVKDPERDGKDIPTGTYTFTAQIFEANDEWQQVRETPAYTGTANLTGAADDVAFDFGSSSYPTLTSGTHKYLVKEVNGGVKGITYDSTVYRLTIIVHEDGTQPDVQIEAEPQASVLSVQSVAFDKTITFTNTYFEEKDPNKCTIDFSKFVKKELTATGTKTASDVDFTVDVKGKKQTTIITSAGGKEEIGTDAEEFDPKYSTTLTAHFDSITGGTVETKSFTGTTVEIDHVGTYVFELSEEDGKRTGVTYDETTYTLHVTVWVDEGALVVGHWYFTDSNGVEHEAFEKATFHNTIDTGKDDYYPIIIPTIIGKDTGMLNKTDHFAYVIGYPDGTVHPNGQITRAEVATIFFRLLRDEVRDGAFTTSNSYSDVAYGKWYNNPISTMSALGIITGYPDGTFKPNKPITRAEFAAIAARFDETQSGKSATFSDVIGHWAAKEIGIAYYNDWIKGYPDGTFKPDQNITRAEAMTLINRVLERKPESPADLLTNMNKWTDNMDTSKWYYLDVQEATNSHGYTRKTFNYELWRQMLNDPDWSRYER